MFIHSSPVKMINSRSRNDGQHMHEIFCTKTDGPVQACMNIIKSHRARKQQFFSYQSSEKKVKQLLIF